MSVIALFNGCYHVGDNITRRIVNETGYVHITDGDILNEASNRFNIPIKKLIRAMYQSPSIFNKFTHEKERSVSYIQLALAKRLKEDNIIYTGFAGHLLPKSISHTLKVCLIADIDYRAGLMEGGSKTSKEVMKNDEGINTWTQYLFRRKPWDSSLYDIVIPIDKRAREESLEASIEEAVHIIYYNLQRDIIKTSEKSKRAMDDFLLASQINMVLAEKGHDVLVYCKDGDVTIVIDKYVLRLESLEKELKDIASTVEGVRGVNTKVGPNFNKPDILYKRYDVEKPSRILLVDDEKDFAHTLSERLQLKDFGSVAVYDGEEALTLVEKEEPEVMVLDLKMPGMGGLQILKEVKEKYPDVKVIILTGHGLDEDQGKAIELGAFAYLQKPVNIEVLMKTVSDAYKDKIKS